MSEFQPHSFVPSDNTLFTISGIFANQARVLHKYGLLQQAAEEAWGTGKMVSLSHSQVYLDLEPSLMPDGTQLPDEVIGFNGILLKGGRTASGQVEATPIAVPVGMYFGNSKPSTTHGINSEAISKGRIGALFPFPEEAPLIIHELAAELDVLRHLGGLPLKSNLRLATAQVQQSFYGLELGSPGTV